MPYINNLTTEIMKEKALKNLQKQKNYIFFKTQKQLFKAQLDIDAKDGLPVDASTQKMYEDAVKKEAAAKQKLDSYINK